MEYFIGINHNGNAQWLFIELIILSNEFEIQHTSLYIQIIYLLMYLRENKNIRLQLFYNYFKKLLTCVGVSM